MFGIMIVVCIFESHEHKDVKPIASAPRSNRSWSSSLPGASLESGCLPPAPEAPTVESECGRARHVDVGAYPRHKHAAAACGGARGTGERRRWAHDDTAPVMRKRAWEIGEMPHPTKWEPPVVIKAPELASAIGLDWAKYHERLGLRKPLPTGEGTPGEDTGRAGTPDEGGPPSATLSIAVTSKMSQNGHTLGMNLSSSGTRTTWTEINEDGHCPTGHWIYEVKVGQWSTDESSEPLPTRAPLSNSKAGKAPTSQAEKPKAAEKTFVITRDGRRLDVGMRGLSDRLYAGALGGRRKRAPCPRPRRPRRRPDFGQELAPLYAYQTPVQSRSCPTSTPPPEARNAPRVLMGQPARILHRPQLGDPWQRLHIRRRHLPCGAIDLEHLCRARPGHTATDVIELLARVQGHATLKPPSGWS